MSSEQVLRAVYRRVARLIARINRYTINVPDGCPNCGFTAVENREHDTCPYCGWGPDTEPERTPEEARAEFMERVMDHVRPW